MTAPAEALFVDGVGALVHLLRTGLPSYRTGRMPVQVFTDLPDEMASLLPVVHLHRTGGATDHPRFFGEFWVPIQCWAIEDTVSDPVWDPRQAAFELSNQVARILYLAWEQQTVTPYGSIVRWRESSGFRKQDDPNLPHASRFVATYDIWIRNPRAS